MQSRFQPTQERWGSEYANTTLFSGGMQFSDGGKVVEDKMLNALLEQRGFLTVFTGEEIFAHWPEAHQD